MQLQFYGRMFLRGWWIIALTALSALVIALTSAYRTTPLYRTSARFIISPNPMLSTSGRDLVSSLSALDKTTIASTFAEVLDSTSIYKETSAELQIDVAQLRSYRISTVVLPDANILELSVTGDNPQVVALLADNVGKKGIDYATALYQVYSISMLDPASIPTTPISPNPKRDASLALVLGAVLGATLVILREQLRAPLVAALRQHTSIDSTSSVYTRGYMLRHLEEVAQNHNGRLSLGLVQFDGLQGLIESLPKPVSQKVLRQITKIFRDELRGSDVVARWNETCFAVLLPMTSGTPAADTIDRLYQILAKPLELDQGITISLNPRAAMIEYQGNEPVNVLIERAEAALKQARQNTARTSPLSADMRPASV